MSTDAHAEHRPLDPNLFGEDQPCFGCSPKHPLGFRLKFAREGESVVTCFVPGEGYQGPPGIMHGGLVMTLADEIAAWTVIGMLEKFGFTVQIEARLKKAVRVGVEVEGRGHIVRNMGRVVRVGVTLAQGGEEMFTGELTFALLDRAKAEKLLGGPLSESYGRFTR